ncbi:MAG: ATP-binding cassette domain-containing protein [Nitrospirae bacterium]|nr:ATP-binding cassette domain-containing protein [Nitrospirota bacterium]
MNALIDIQRADVQIGNQKILSDISWRLQKDENWTLLGSNGAGKTTFLKLIHGDIWHNAGSRIYAIQGEPQESPIGIKNHAALVSPEMLNAYAKYDWNIKVEEVIHTGFADTVWLFDKPNKHQISIADRIIEQLGIDSLRQKEILRISSGEAKKVMIARALVSEPVLLMLDEICNDPDADSREAIIDIIDQTALSGTQIIYSTHRTLEMPNCITHALVLDRGSIVMQSGKKDLPHVRKQAYIRMTSDESIPIIEKKESEYLEYKSESAPLIEIKNADIYIGDWQILHNINWRINKGEHWAISGKNGAGKSTLFKLIMAELHPASGGKILRFNLQNDASVWDVRKRIGYVSSSLQASYDWGISAEDVVLSGFFSSIGLYDEVSKAQKEAAIEWLHILRIDNLRNRRILSLSYGESRKVLLARAMVNKPDMLLLDEPFNGLDEYSRSEFLNLVEQIGRMGTTIVMSTHHRNEIIPIINHELKMKGGRILSSHRILKTIL